MHTKIQLKRLFTRSMRKELIAAALATSMVPLLVCAGLVLALSSHCILRAERQQTRSIVPSVQAVLAMERENLLTTVHDYAFWDETAARVRQEDIVWLRENIADSICDTYRVSSVAIVDEHGCIVVSRTFPEAALASLSITSPPPVNSRVQDLIRLPNTVAIAIAEPIRSKDGRRTGATLIALKNIDTALLARVQQFAGIAGVTLHDGHSTLSSTGKQIAEPRLASGSVPANETVAAGDYVATDAPLYNASGLQVAWVRAINDRVLTKASNQATLIALGVGLVLALATTVVAASIYTRRFRRRLSSLTQAARAIAAGDATQPLRVSRDDEIGEAKVAFNHMSSHIASTIGTLTQRLQYLTTELAELSMLTDTLVGCGDLRPRIIALCARVAEAFRADAVGIFLAEADDLVSFAAPDTAPLHKDALRATAVQTIAAGQPRIIRAWVPEAVRGDRDVPPLGSLACSPLATDGTVFGALAIGSLRGDRFDEAELLVLSTVASQITVALGNAEVVARLEGTNRETVRALAAAMEAKDEYTAEHAESLALSAVAVGRQLDLTEEELRTLEYAALLHDIGKIGVPRHILNKPDQLTEEEFAEIAKHTILGERISAQVDDLKPVARIIRSAHERWDGRGYPDGLAGEQIPLLARILLVCDAFDAMTSNRPYRPAMPTETALLEVRACAGMQFDPRVVDALVHVFEHASRLGTGGVPEMPIYVWHQPRRISQPEAPPA